MKEKLKIRTQLKSECVLNVFVPSLKDISCGSNGKSIVECISIICSFDSFFVTML